MEDYSVAQLEEMLKAARDREREAAEAARKAVQIVREYTWRPTTETFHSILPDSGISLWRLEGRVTNKEEALAAGHPRDLHEGGMTYYVNDLNGAICGWSGGGVCYLGFLRDNDELQNLAYAKLEAFMHDNPDGGDVTDIVEAYQEAAGIFRGDR